jgi:hypothetical protein
LIIVASVVIFIVLHYQFDQGTAGGLDRIKDALFDRHNEKKGVLVGIITMLSLLALCYPFTLAGWKHLLSTMRQPAPSPG